jgi:ABC-type Mn2+/Zn2+ transport system permease subunit
VRHVIHLYDSGLLRRALLEAVLVGALCGAVGAHVVLRRLPFFTITVAHATFPGIVLATIIGLSELVGGLAFATLLVLAIYLTTGDQNLDNNTAVGVALAGSFGLGVMLQSAQDGFTKDLTAILVGSVLTVDHRDVVITAVVGVVVLGALAGAHKELVFRAFDPEGAAAQGYPRLLDLALLLAVAATVVTTIPAVGTILAVALLSVPAMTARLVTRRVSTAMVVGAAYGATSGVVGLTASAEWDFAAGASIALSSALLFVLTFAAVSASHRLIQLRALHAVANAAAA